MAFQFVVETGVGDPDANSYASVEFADDYVSMNAFASTQWDLLETEDKEKLLARASLILDKRIKWAGDRVDSDSGLRWPRAGVYDADGFIIPDDVIPDELVEATVEFATYLMTTDWTADTLVRSGALTKVKVDVIELEYEENASAKSVRNILPDTILAMLEHLGVVPRAGATAFKKIVRH